MMIDGCEGDVYREDDSPRIDLEDLGAAIDDKPAVV